MRRPWGRIAASCFALIIGCAPHPYIQLPKQEPEPERPISQKPNPAADEALQKAIVAADTAPSKAKAAEALLAMAKAFPGSTAAAEALYRAGVVYFEAGDFASARRVFNELLFVDPLFPKANDAKLKLGLSGIELGSFRDAFQTLWSIADRSTGQERATILAAAVRAAEGALLYTDALKVQILLADETGNPAEQAKALDHVTDLVEGKVPFIEIAKVAEDLPATNPAWPILTFKLARIYYHLRDWSHLEDALKRFIDHAPGHPLLPQAQELLARANRRTQDVKAKRIGVILPMTGRYQPFGDAVMRGLKLALADSDIELLTKDSQGEMNLAGKAVEDLTFEDGAIAIIGPLLGDDSKRAALVAEELQVPILTLTRADRITEIGPHVFRNMLTTSAQAEALADYGTRVLGYKSFALLYPSIPYGTELVNSFWDKLSERGAQVRGAESYAYDQTTFTSEAKKLVGRYYVEDRPEFMDKRKEILENKELDEFRKRKAIDKLLKELEPVIDFDAIFIPDDWKRVGLVAPALAFEDIVTNACDPKELEKIRKSTGKENVKSVTLLGSNQWSSPKDLDGVPELLKRGQKFVLCSIYVDGFFADSSRRATQRFVKAFREANKDLKRDPNLLEAIGFDAGGMVRSIVEGKSPPKTREDFRDQLASLKNFEGATGRTSFNELREAQKPLFLLTIDGKGVHEIPSGAKIGGS